MKVPNRIETIIMNALQGGVVPRTGLGYIAVGREQEITTLLKDVEIVENGGATFRFVSGTYGSGKTFLLQTIKEYALSKGMVVADTDLSPNRSLIGTNNKKKGLATYRELMCNLSIKTSPMGGALGKILDLWLNEIWVNVAKNIGQGGIQGNALEDMVANTIYDTILDMQEMVHGYDFANILVMYWKASRVNDAEIKAKTLRWLRGEYNTKPEAKHDLGVSNIINDDDWYEYIKLMSNFFVKIGYKGFIVVIDELINIYKCTSSITRNNNYEKILAMYNDTMPPIIRIIPLSKEEIIVLLEKLAEIHADLYEYELKVKSEDIVDFIGEAVKEKEDITPRSIIRDFIEILNLSYQNYNFSIREIMDTFKYSNDKEDIEDIEE